MKLQTFSLLAASLVVAGLAIAQDDDSSKPTDDAAADNSTAKVETPFFGNTTCPVSGKPIKKDKFVQQKGERVYVCCNMCKKKVRTDFATNRNKAYPADGVVEVGNERCPIMGGKTEGKDSYSVFQNHKVLHCCDGCKTKFNANARRYLTLMTTDVTPLNNKICIVMPEDPIENDNFFVYDGVLIDTCCSDCPEMFGEEPDRYLKEAGINLKEVKQTGEK